MRNKYEKGDYIFFTFLGKERLKGRVISLKEYSCVVELCCNEIKNKNNELTTLEVDYNEIIPISPQHFI